MTIRYELDPTMTDTVRAIDDASGLNHPVYDPQMASQLRASTQPGAYPAQSDPTSDAPDALTSQFAGGVPPMGPPASAGPPPAVLPQSQPGLPPPASPPQPVMQTGAPAPAPPPPGPGMVLSEAKVKPGTPGGQYDQAAEDKRNNALVDRNLDLQQRQAQTTGALDQFAQTLQQQGADDEKARQGEAAKAQRYENELNTVVKTELDPGRLVKQEGLGGAILGLVGMALAGFSKNPGLNMSQMNQALDGRIAQDISIQREQKNSLINTLTRQLGSSQQAEAQYRASVRTAAFQRLETNLKSQGVYNQYSDLMQAGRDELQTLNDAAKQASYGKPGAAEYTYSIPKPVKGAGMSAAEKAAAKQTAAIQNLPPGAEQYQATELQKAAAARGESPEHTNAAYGAYREKQAEGSQARQAINDAEEAIKNGEKSGDVAGKGLIAEHFPQWLQSEEGRHTHAAIALAKEYMIKELHGVKSNPEAMGRLDRIIDGTGTYDDLKFGLDTVKRANEAMQNETYDPTFKRIYNETSSRSKQERSSKDPNKAAQDSMPPAAAGAPVSPADVPLHIRQQQQADALAEKRRLEREKLQRALGMGQPQIPNGSSPFAGF